MPLWIPAPEAVLCEQSADPRWIVYRDPQGRFSFSYPPEFGTPERGTDSGFQDRVASIRFSDFSSGLRSGAVVLGGELTLSAGFDSVDLQALGGLRDALVLGTLPDSLRQRVQSSLPPLTPAVFCRELGREQHVDLSGPQFSWLDPARREALRALDGMRNVNPHVHRCAALDDSVSFHKEAGFIAGGVERRQHIYGAIRILKPPFTSVQLIRATVDAPDEALLETMAKVVRSFDGSRATRARGERGS